MLKRGIDYIRSQKQFHNLVIYGFGQFFNLATPLIVVPYIVSVCGEEGYGKIGVGMAISFLLIVIIDYGSDIIGVKDVAVNRENKQKLEEIMVNTYAAKAILLLGVTLCVSALYLTVPYFAKEKALFFLGWPILLGQLINPTWFLQGVENFKWITFLNILSKVIYVVGVFASVNSADDYIYANLWWGIGMVVANGIALGYVLLTHRFSFGNASWEKTLGLLKDNFSMFSSQIFVSLQLYAPIMLISFFGGNRMAGQYKIVEQIVVIFKTYILLFFNYVYPRLCYLLETDMRKGLRFWKIYNGANFGFIAISMLGVFVFAREIVTYFKPASIAEITALLRFAVLIPLTMAISIPLKQLVLGWDYHRYYIRLTTAMVAFNLAAIVILLPYFAIYGVLASLIVAEILTGVLYFLVIQNKLRARDI
jgi:O-antigen/teichoic acid export membrane protein